jgi:hypothetical protein
MYVLFTFHASSSHVITSAIQTAPEWGSTNTGALDFGHHWTIPWDSFVWLFIGFSPSNQFDSGVLNPPTPAVIEESVSGKEAHSRDSLFFLKSITLRFTFFSQGFDFNLDLPSVFKPPSPCYSSLCWRDWAFRIYWCSSASSFWSLTT